MNTVIVGVTYLDIQLEDSMELQYAILTKSGNRYYEYTLIPSAQGYKLKVSPTMSTHVEYALHTPMELVQDNNAIYAQNSDLRILIFNTHTKEIGDIISLCKENPDYTLNRQVLVIYGNGDEIVPFLSPEKSVGYTDLWETIPNVIADDIIIVNENQIPIEEIQLRLPKDTKLNVLYSRK